MHYSHPVRFLLPTLLMLGCAGGTPDTAASSAGESGGGDDGGGEDSGSSEGGGSEGGGTDGSGGAEFVLPDGPWEQVDVGGYHGCALDSAGAIGCWGMDSDGQASPPDGPWASVSAGLTHTCALDGDGAIACWGNDAHGQASPPEGTGFQRLSAGMTHTCAISEEGQVQCWGSDLDGQSSVPEGLQAVEVAAGGSTTLAVDVDGELSCWGQELYCFTGRVDQVVAVSNGFQHALALRGGGTVACAGFGGEGRCPPPELAVERVSAGGYHTCGSVEGSLHCWPESGYGGEPSWPEEEVSAVSSGLVASCAIDRDGELLCWTTDGSPLEDD